MIGAGTSGALLLKKNINVTLRSSLPSTFLVPCLVISGASYLLAPGVFSERLHACGADMVSDPIGVHPLVVEAVASAYAAVVDERRDVPGQAPGVGRERIA